MYRSTAVSRRIVAFPLLLAAALVGCGDAGPSEVIPIEAAYTLDVNGALTERASGEAYFGSDQDEQGQPIFVLLLGDDTSRHLLIAGKPGATRPGTGQHAIVDPDRTQSGWSLIHMVSDGDELLGMFVATAGTLTITESTEDVLRGSLEYAAVGFMGTAEDSIAVDAEFVAAPASRLGAAAAAAVGARTGR